MYVYVYVCTYMCACMYVCVCIYICKYVSIFLYVVVYIYIDFSTVLLAFIFNIGSFVKCASIYKGCTLREALNGKYLTELSVDSDGNHTVSSNFDWDKNNDRKSFDVTLVGVKKVQKKLDLALLTKVSLERELVSVLVEECSSGTSSGDAHDNADNDNNSEYQLVPIPIPQCTELNLGMYVCMYVSVDGMCIHLCTYFCMYFCIYLSIYLYI